MRLQAGANQKPFKKPRQKSTGILAHIVDECLW